MMELRPIEERFVEALRQELHACRLVTDAYYDSFDFTRTGNNLCHPRTLGLVAKACWALEGVGAVDIDCRFNLGRGVKFQPDVTCVSEEGEPVLFIDFESPNSSDARIPGKDVASFWEWQRRTGSCAWYFIITSLPRRPAPGKWELRYTAKGSYNEAHNGKLSKVTENPFAYWYRWYRTHVDRTALEETRIRFLNLDGKGLELVDPFDGRFG